MVFRSPRDYKGGGFETSLLLNTQGMTSTSVPLQQILLACGGGNQAGLKAAEAKLQQLRSQDINYPRSLLELISKASSLQIQLRAAIEFKLWCKQYATLQRFDADRYSVVISDVKTTALQLYLTINDKPYQQLKEALTHICTQEYFENWKELPQQLISVAGQNYGYLIRILSLFKKITQRYAYQTRSDPLYQEIIFSCDQMHNFLLSTFEITLTTVRQTLNQEALKALEEALKLFYNLNYQDLHPHFEDNLPRWMQLLVQTLSLQGPTTNSLLFKCKGAALKAILLYANKYHEDIEGCVESFSKEVWKLFTDRASLPADNEQLILDGIRFFRHLVTWSSQKKTYQNNIPLLIQTLIIPNIGVTQDVKDEFDQDTERFIEIYFQNNDMHSKRSHSIDLFKTINRIYPVQTSQFFLNYINAQATRQLTIPEECLLYNIIIDGGSGGFNSSEGITSLNISEEVVKQCYLVLLKPKFQAIYQWILNNPHTEVESNLNPLQIAFQLRFIYAFRIFIPREDLQLLLKYTSSLISNNSSLRNIIYMTVNAFLSIKHGNYILYKNLVYYFNPDNIDNVAVDVLTMIYLNQQKEKKLNNRLNVLLQTVTMIFKQKILHYQKHMITILDSLLSKTDQYQFKTILHIFEAFGNFIYWVVQQGGQLSQVEKLLDSHMTKMMAANSDLINFMLQLYSIVVLEKTHLTEVYHNFYKSLIKAQNWNESNVTLLNSYMLYINSYLSKHPDNIVSDKSNIELILTRLIELKKPTIFFNMLTDIYKTCKLEIFNSVGYLRIVIIGIEAMIQSLPELKNHILKTALYFMCNMINENNPQTVVQHMNSNSPGFLETLLSQSIHIISAISWKDERKSIIMAMCSLLSNNCFSSVDVWGVILNALVKNTNRRIRVSQLMGKNALVITAPVEGSFQKLTVFKLIKSAEARIPQEVKFDQEERQFMKCVKKLMDQIGLQKLGGVLTLDNQKQLTILIKKYQQEQQKVV